METRLARYPQLYSCVGFAHRYRPLQGDELAFVLTRHWRQLGPELDDADLIDAQAIASLAPITGGNFRLLQRLFVQIGCILRINGLTAITDDVVHAARATLVIGATWRCQYPARKRCWSQPLQRLALCVGPVQNHGHDRAP